MNIKRTLLDDSLPPDNMSARSATEIVERMRELSTNIGSAFGRLITETMIPLVRRSMAIMNEAGLIVLPLRINGLEVKIVPVSPLAKAQNFDNVQDVMQWVQIAGGLGPGAASTVKLDAVADYIGEQLNIPRELITSDEERAAIEEALQQQMKAMGGGQAPGEPPAPEEEMMEAVPVG